MRPLTILLLLTLTLNCFGQYQFDNAKVSPQVQKIVSKIKKVNELMGSAVYEAGIRPKQFNHFTQLHNIATQAELIELTNHPNGVVRCYAFWALSYDSSANLLPVVINHIRDTESVNTQFGCIGASEKVGDFFINVVTPQYVDINSKKLTASEFEHLDSILVYTPNNLYAKNNAIDRRKTNESFYLQIRNLVVKENNQSALVRLAKFRREQDIPLILKNRQKGERYNQLFFTYKAISEFPHFSFLPLLRQSLYEAIEKGAWSTEWRELYNAIASYRNDTALQLLKIPFTQVRHENIRQYHIGFVFEAIQKFYSPIYDDLLWQMWENENKITSEVFRLLYSKNPDKAFELSKRSIENAGDIYYLNTAIYSEDREVPINLLDIMIDTILIRDRPYAVRLINENLEKINVHQFPTFADKALKLKDTSFVMSLFNRLEKEDNPHVYLKAAKVLIAFTDKQINQRIVEVYNRNINLRQGWGGQELAALLKANHIN
jgi:hypothetical protein